MAGDALIIAAATSGVGGGALLRYAWGLAHRSPEWNATAWGLFALSLIVGWMGGGAWGASIAALFGMGMALLLLGYAAASAPPPTNAKASNRRVGALPEGGEPWRLGRRIGTFLIVTVAAMIVALGLALAMRGLLAWAGAGEANVNVLSFYVMPLAWALLAFLLLMEERRAGQWRLLAFGAVPGVIAVVTGMAT